MQLRWVCLLRKHFVRSLCRVYFSLVYSRFPSLRTFNLWYIRYLSLKHIRLINCFYLFPWVLNVAVQFIFYMKLVDFWTKLLFFFLINLKTLIEKSLLNNFSPLLDYPLWLSVIILIKFKWILILENYNILNQSFNKKETFFFIQSLIVFIWQHFSPATTI